MMARLAVYVYGTDPVSQAGVAGQLRGRPEIWVVDDGDVDAAAVAVLVADEIDDSITTVARAVQRNGCPRVVLVVTHLVDAGLVGGVEAGACGFLRRADATPERLVETIRSAASGDGSMSSDLLGRLLSQICTLSSTMLSQRGLSLAGL